ncbi:MAG: GNAT family N-acetyltransferase [Gammaproteobacteria bacterium]
MFLRRMTLALRRPTVSPTFSVVKNRNFHTINSVIKPSSLSPRSAQCSKAFLHTTKNLFSPHIPISDHISTINSNHDYDLVLDSKMHALSLLKKDSTDIITRAYFSYVREEEIALLSNIKSAEKEHEQIFLQLLQNYLAQKRADLFYYDASKDLSLVKNLDPSHYDANVMLLPKKKDLSEMKVRQLEGLIIDKTKLLTQKNIKLMKDFLLENTYWAKNEGTTGLTEDMLANRIKESSLTLALLDSVKGCRGFVSYFSNGEIGYLYNMTIHKSDRGHGIGKALLYELTQRIPENHIIFLITATEGPSVDAARKLYEQFGFQSLCDHSELRQLAVVKDVPRQALCHLIKFGC